MDVRLTQGVSSGVPPSLLSAASPGAVRPCGEDLPASALPVSPRAWPVRRPEAGPALLVPAEFLRGVCVPVTETVFQIGFFLFVAGAQKDSELLCIEFVSRDLADKLTHAAYQACLVGSGFC